MRSSMPRTRRQRVKWLQQHRGDAFILHFEYKTDRDVKRIFEAEYQKGGAESPRDLSDVLEGIADELSL